MNTKQTKSLVQLANEVSLRAATYLEQAQACSKGHGAEPSLEFAHDAMLYWEQAHEAFDELSEIVDIIKDSDKVPPPAVSSFNREVVSSSSEADDTPTVEVLPSAWSWEE